MRDEFPKTRLWLRDLAQVTSWSRDIITGQLRGELAQTKIGECEGILDKIEEMNCSPENWPMIIRELLDCARCRQELQSYYNIWIRDVANGVVVYGKADLDFLFRANGMVYSDVDYESIIGQAARQLIRIRQRMWHMFALIQELKLEYGLHDEDDLRFSSAFRACDGVEYVNGPQEDETKNFPYTADILRMFRTKYICERYKDIEERERIVAKNCDEFLSVDAFGWRPSDIAQHVYIYCKNDKLCVEDYRDKKNIFLLLNGTDDKKKYKAFLASLRIKNKTKW